MQQPSAAVAAAAVAVPAAPRSAGIAASAQGAGAPGAMSAHEADASSHALLRAQRERRVWLALVLVITAGCLIAAATVAVALARGEGWKQALRSTSLAQVHRLRLQGGMDSWGPMWAGLARQREAAAGSSVSSAAGASAGSAVAASAGSGSGPSTPSPYEQALRLDHCKFQYPPSSWLLLEMLPEPASARGPLSCVGGGEPGADIHSAAWSAKPWLALASALACLGLVAVSMAMLWRALAPAAAVSPSAASPAMPALPGALTARAPLWLAAGLAGLGFYPLVKGHTLGQLQVFINLALGVALLSWPRRPGFSGVLVGLCCLFKPQYLLLLAWGLLRRHRTFAAALAAVFIAGHGLALWRYGLEVHLQYLQLLRELAQVGEAFWANQSANGLLNRLRQTGDAVAWAPAAFPAYDPLVRWGTLGSSLALLGLAIWPPRQGAAAPGAASASTCAAGVGRATALDFAAMLAAVTLASPIAWEHHYGSFLPVFALLLGVLATQPRWPRGSVLLLGVSFVAMSHAVLRPEWIFVGPFAGIGGIAGSHLWLGAVLLFGLLLRWRARLAATPAAAVGSTG